MAIDYFILLEGDVNFESFVIKLAQHAQFTLEANDGNILRLSEVSGMFYLYARREIKDGENHQFDQCSEYLPETFFSVRLNKEGHSEAKVFLARVVKTVIECTQKAVTVLINGETLLLRRKSGEAKPIVCMMGFWAESEVQMLLAT